MKKVRTAALVFAVCLCLTLSGCDLFTVETEMLMSPPELSGNMQPISKALSDSVKGEYQLKYPSSGEKRSAIVLEDVDGDGTAEAFAFYSTSNDEMTNMHINAICAKDDGYISVGEQSIVAGGVERVDFYDIDGDGAKEIIVGWEVYGLSEKQLCVYDLTGDTLAQRLSEKYTAYLCCDLSGNGKYELLIQMLNTSDALNTADLYRFTKTGQRKIGSCLLDGAAKTVSDPVFSTLSNGKPAVYIDEIKGAGAVTEVIYFANEQLKNPLTVSAENTATLRAAAIQCRDIDGDGTLEIPAASPLPNAAGTDEALYYTNWCAFDGIDLTAKVTTVVNTVDGYYLTVPEKLVGKIAVLKDIDNHRRVFYNYDAETGTVGMRIATLAVFSASDWDSDESVRAGMFELARSGKNVFAGAVNMISGVGIGEEQLREMFNLDKNEVKR